MKSVALFHVNRDWGVVMLDLKIAGLTEDSREKTSVLPEEIERDLHNAIAGLSEMYRFDMALRDMMGRRYLASLYVDSGIVHYVVLISSKHTLRGVVKRLKQQVWRLLLSIEQKQAKKTYETY